VKQAARLDLIGRRSRVLRATGSLSSLPDMRLLDIDGALIRVRVAGKGPPVLLVPDPPNVIEHYGGLFASLKQDFTVVCFDLVGFGFSVAPRGFEFSIEEQAGFAAGLIRALDVRGAVWAACCLPAYVGLAVARQAPSLLRALVAGQAPSWDQELRWARQMATKGGLGTPVLGQVVMSLMKKRVASGWYDVAASEKARPWMSEAAMSAFERGASFPLASAFQASFSEGQATGPVEIPSTFVWGALDRTHRKTDQQSSTQNARDPRLVTFDRSAHFPDLEEPDRFIEQIHRVGVAR
jgi:pimeloyl-ACP methyl ester carboxylesterase